MTPLKIKPLFNRILLTMNKYTEDQKVSDVLIDAKKSKGDLKEIQKVVEIGTSVSIVKPGDYVKINPTRYLRNTNSIKDMDKSKAEMTIEFPVITLGGVDYLFLFDTDVDYIVTEWAPDADTKLYVPGKKNIIS